MRRVLVVSLASLVITGAALGGTFKGSSRPDHLSGTATGDVLYGYGGNDEIDGLAGDDLINGGAGADVLSGGAGNDRIAAADGTQDVVRCGPGRDIVTADMEDSLSGCEVVSRRLSRDRYRAGGAQHETEVERTEARSSRRSRSAVSSTAAPRTSALPPRTTPAQPG